MNVFILHPSSLQVRIWKKICRSQNWTTSIFAQDRDLRQAVILAEEVGERLADVILVAESVATPGPDNLCQWLMGRLQLVPFILLTDAAPQSITVTRKQLAKAKGAYRLLPDFSAETIALDAVKGLNCVAGLQELSIDSKALQKSIVELKSEFTTSSSDSQTSNERQYRGQTYQASNTSENPSKKKSESRRYRGQSY